MSEQMNSAFSPLSRLLTVLFGMVLLCALGLWVGQIYYDVSDFALHATLETTGSVVMLLLALFIFKIDNNHHTFSRVHYVSLAFTAMAVLNLFHAASNSEAYFIWPHALSTLVGSSLLLTVFLPEKSISRQSYYAIPLVIILLTTSFALLLALDKIKLPNAIIHGQFTPEVLVIYNISTLLYLISAAYFIVRYWRHQQHQDLYLLTIILLLATASFLFLFSTPWQLTWWYWHVIKLIAFLVIFVYFVTFIANKNKQFIAREIESNIIQYSADAIITKSLDNIILTWNPSAERLLGYRASDIIGQSMTMFYQTEWLAEENKITQQIVSGSPFSQHETLFVARDKSLIDVALTLSPIKDSHGKVIGISKIIRDIRSQKEAERKNQDINKELEKKVTERTLQLQNAYDEMEAFTYSVSHDLRSPLRATDGFSQALLEDYGDKLDATAKDYLNRIRNASQKMAGLIDDLLQLSRQTRTDMQPSVINLGEMAEQIITELRQQDPNRRVEVIIAPHLVTYADENLMRIVLTNLLGNAWKYTSHQPQAHIEFGVTMKGDEKPFFIRDNGAGFDMAYSDKLFKPFHRLHSAQEFTGNGIGLAMVYRIIKRHLGRVWAIGEVNQGACFYFTVGFSEANQTQ